MKRLRGALCALLTVALLLTAAPSAAAEESAAVSQAFVQGETLFVYTPVEEGLTAQLHYGELPIPASRGVQSVAEAGYPVAYYLMIDISTSMRSLAQKVRSFAAALTQTSAPGTRFAVLSFGESLAVVQEETQDADELLDALTNLGYDARMTDLPQGVIDGLDYLERAGREEGELIHAVLISDGVTDGTEDTPGLEAARQQAAASPGVLLHTLGLGTSRAESPEGLDALTSLGVGVHAEMSRSQWNGEEAAAEVAEYSDSLSVLTFPLGRTPAAPFEGSVFFLSDDGESEGELRGQVKLENVPVISQGETAGLPLPGEGEEADGAAEPEEGGMPGGETEPGNPDIPGALDGSQPSDGSQPEGEGAPAEESGGGGKLLAIGIGAAAVLLLVLLGVLLYRRRRTRKRPPAVRAEERGIYMRLEVVSGEYAGKWEEFSLVDELTIGSGRSCDLIWEDEDVEPLHARIFLRGGLIFLEDLGSDQGTLLGGMRLHEANRLRSGDEITVGSARFRMKF